MTTKSVSQDVVSKMILFLKLKHVCSSKQIILYTEEIINVAKTRKLFESLSLNMLEGTNFSGHIGSVVSRNTLHLQKERHLGTHVYIGG